MYRVAAEGQRTIFCAPRPSGPSVQTWTARKPRPYTQPIGWSRWCNGSTVRELVSLAGAGSIPDSVHLDAFTLGNWLRHAPHLGKVQLQVRSNCDFWLE